MERLLVNLAVVSISGVGILVYAIIKDGKTASLYLTFIGLASSTYILLVYGWLRMAGHILVYVGLAVTLEQVFKKRSPK